MTTTANSTWFAPDAHSVIYLNNAATSFPKPGEVVAAATQALVAPPRELGRGSSGSGTADDVLTKCRRELAALTTAPSSTSFVFTSGATHALNLAIKGLPLAIGARVVTTAAEHTSVLRPLVTLERAGAIRLAIIDCDKDGRVSCEAMVQALTQDTAALVVSHCSNVTGEVLDLQPVISAARFRGVFTVVDASQSAGLVPLDLASLDADLVAFAGHKGLFGLSGVGALYIRQDLEITPLITGGTGVRSDLLTQPTERPHRYEAGTPNHVGVAALAAGVEFVRRVGVETISAKLLADSKELHARLAFVPGVRRWGRTEGPGHSPFVNFTIEGMDPADCAYALEHSFDVWTRAGLHCAPLMHRALGSWPGGTVRLSPSWFTTTHELEVAVDAIARLAHGQSLAARTE